MKQEIKQLVDRYLQELPKEELEAFKKFMKVKLETADNKEYLKVKGEHAIKRLLFELPEGLYKQMQNGLSDEAFDWLFNDPSHKGSTWFGNTYPIFRVGEKS